MVSHLTARMFVFTAVAALVPAVSASAAVTPPFTFVGPGGWGVGTALTTYQEWAANPADKIDGVPNVGFNDAGAGVTQPTLTPGHTGFVPSSGGLYSFSDWYTVTTVHDAPGAGVPAGAGTHVIIQTFASINDDDGQGRSGTVLGIELTDAASALLAGAVHLRSDTYGQQQGFASPFGPVDAQATIDEYWIPNFTGDFRIVLQEIVHSSFMGMRVDAAIVAPGGAGGSPFAATVVPEPASLVVLGAGMTLLLGRRRR